MSTVPEQTKSYLIQGLTQFVLNERELIAQGKISSAKRRITQYISAKDKSLETIALQIWDAQLAPKNGIEQAAYHVKPDYALRVGIEDAVQRHLSGKLSSRDEAYRKLAATPRPSGFKRAVYGAATGLALMTIVATANLSCNTNGYSTDTGSNRPAATLSQKGPSWCIATNEGKVSCTPFEDDAAATQPASAPATQPASCPTLPEPCTEARFEFKYNSGSFASKDTRAQLTDLVVESAIVGLNQFYINAYASIDGKTSRNQRLSERRARALAREVYSVARKNKIKVEVFYAGKGETQSIDEKVYAPNRMAIVATSPTPDLNQDKVYSDKQKSQTPGVAYNLPCVDGNGGMKRYIPTSAKPKPVAEPGKRQIEPEKLTPLPITIREKYTFKDQAPVEKAPASQITPSGVPTVQIETPASQPAKKCRCKMPQELSDRIAGINHEVEHLSHEIAPHDWLASMVEANCTKGSDMKNLCAVQEYKQLCCKKGPQALKKSRKITACQQAYSNTKSGLETARQKADKIGREIDYARSHAHAVKKIKTTDRMLEPAEKKLNENYRSIDSAVQRLKVPETKKGSKPQAALTEQYAGARINDSQPVSEEKAAKLAELKQEIRTLAKYSRKYLRMANVLVNECSPTGTTATLCSMPEYGRHCNNGNPRIALTADSPSACMQAMISTQIGLDAAEVQSKYLEKQIRDIKRDNSQPGKKQTDALPGHTSLESKYDSTGVSYAEVLREYISTKQDRFSVAELRENFGLDEVLANMPEYRGGRAKANAEERTARREIVYEAYSNGTSKREIADALGVSRSTVDRDIKLYEQNYARKAA